MFGVPPEPGKPDPLFDRFGDWVVRNSGWILRVLWVAFFLIAIMVGMSIGVAVEREWPGTLNP